MHKHSAKVRENVSVLNSSDKHNVFNNAAKIALNFISRLHGESFQFTYFNYRRLKRTNPLKAPHSCPYCLSFGFWRDSIESHFKEKHYFDDAIFLSENEKDSVFIAPFILNINDAISRIAKHQIKLIYERVLLGHFFSILYIMLKIDLRYDIVALDSCKKRLIRFSEAFINHSHLYYVNDNNESINFYVNDFTDLASICPSDDEIIKTQNDCRQFHSEILDQKWVFHESL